MWVSVKMTVVLRAHCLSFFLPISFNPNVNSDYELESSDRVCISRTDLNRISSPGSSKMMSYTESMAETFSITNLRIDDVDPT